MEVMEPLIKSPDTKLKCLADSDISSSGGDSQVILLSDLDSDSDESSVSLEIIEEKPLDTIILDDTIEQESIESEVILLDDSAVTNEKTKPFTIDTTPDFIPVPNYIKNWRKKRKFNVWTSACKKVVKNEIQKQQQHSRKRRKCAVENQREDVLNSYLENVSCDNHRNKHTPIIQLNYPNILNSNSEVTQNVGLRPVIIDGCNVGYGYGNGVFKMQGIIRVVQYFKNRGHEEIVCFLPQRYRHKVRSPSEERTVTLFEKDNIFSFTPSRNLDNGKRITPYDDRYVVQYASERKGVIISNDGYRDLINEEPSWRETIEKRIINYTFARGLFMLPKDPLGPSGPTLDEMLSFP